MDVKPFLGLLTAIVKIVFGGWVGGWVGGVRSIDFWDLTFKESNNV